MLTIAFLVDSVEFTKAVRDGQTSLGGSESACLGLARALRARGHDVRVFATKLAPEAGGADPWGVSWHPAESFYPTNQFIEFDVVVALRQFGWFAQPVHARLRLLWNQDLMVPGVGAQVMAVAWALDHLVYVSEYHRAQWEDQEAPLAPIGWVTRNGYDPTLLPTKAVTKDAHRIIHISRPERGIGPLLRLWPLLKARVPDATLQICRYSSMYDPKGWGSICASWDAEVQRVNAEVGGITYLGELNKVQLYQAISEAAVMWYPGVSTFAETSCIAAIEAMACGTPFVGSLKGALAETARPAYLAGHLIPGAAEHDEAYATASVDAVVSLLEGCARQSFAYRVLQREGRKHVEAYTFEQLAGEWEAQVEAWFGERYAANRVAIMRQLLHEDDHVVGKHVANDVVADAADEASPASMDAFNEANAASLFCDRVITGKEETATDYAENAIHDPLEEIAKYGGRIQAVLPKFAQATRILDIACGNGANAIALALEYPEVRVVGIDYAPENIARAIAGAAQAGVADRCRFVAAPVWDFATGAPAVTAVVEALRGEALFDALLVGEFVEHIADCTTLVDWLETWLVEGAVAVYTCPLGPFVELAARGMHISRGHVHCFKSDDVQAVWGAKKHAATDFMSVGLTSRGSPVGHWLISYEVERGRAAGQRRIADRAQRTRPMQRLSVGIIARNAENDLARCLTSVWPIADEIVIGDTGSTDDTIAIAEKFGAKVLTLAPIADQPEGFAGARNQVLAACSGDWFLWIDTDEILDHGHLLRTYLQGRVFHGFVLHQKHVYQDAPPTYDIPVRVFRTGRDVRFYGCVHEQPQQGDCNADIFPTLEPHDVEILHTGYLTSDIRETKRLARNQPLIIKDQQVFPDRLLGKVILIREGVLQAQVNRAAAGGMTARAHAGFERAVSMFVQLFDDPGHKYHPLIRGYYEQALQALGIGYEIEIAIGGKAGGLKGSHAKPTRVWVRDGAEFERLIAHQAQQIAKRMTDVPLKTDPFVLPARDREAVTA